MESRLSADGEVRITHETKRKEEKRKNREDVNGHMTPSNSSEQTPSQSKREEISESEQFHMIKKKGDP